MVFNLLPVELQVQVCSYLNRPQLERLACANRQCNAVVNRYEYRWPLHRLSLVIQGESQLYRLHNFDAGAMQQVTHAAFYRLLRRARIEFILLTEDPDFPMPNLDHLPRQLWRFRRYWTGARIDFRHLPIAQPAWNRVLNLFGNANRWYFHATYFLFPVPEVLSGHHRHRVAEARMVTMQPPAARLFEYLQLPRTDGGYGRRLIISEGCFNTYAFLTQLQHLYASLESPPPGPFAVLVLQPKEQWNDYHYYSRPLRQLLLYATAPRNPRANGTLHFGEAHLGFVFVISLLSNGATMTWPSGPADKEMLSLQTHCIIELAKNFEPWRKFIKGYARWILLQTPGHWRYRPQALPARLELPIAYGFNILGIPLIEIGHLRAAVDEYSFSRNNLDNLAD